MTWEATWNRVLLRLVMDRMGRASPEAVALAVARKNQLARRCWQLYGDKPCPEPEWTRVFKQGVAWMRAALAAPDAQPQP